MVLQSIYWNIKWVCLHLRCESLDHNSSTNGPNIESWGTLSPWTIIKHHIRMSSYYLHNLTVLNKELLRERHWLRIPKGTRQKGHFYWVKLLTPITHFFYFHFPIHSVPEVILTVQKCCVYLAFLSVICAYMSCTPMAAPPVGLSSSSEASRRFRLETSEAKKNYIENNY